MKKILYSLVAFVLSCSSVCDAQNMDQCAGVRTTGAATATCLTNNVSNSLALTYDPSGQTPPTINVVQTFSTLCDTCGCNAAKSYCDTHGTTDPNGIGWESRVTSPYAFDNDPGQAALNKRLAGCYAGAFWSCPNPNQGGELGAVPPAGFVLDLK